MGPEYLRELRLRARTARFRNQRGKGLPRVNANGVGDLHVRVQQWTPSEISGEERKLLKQMAELRPTVAQPRHKGFWSKMKEALRA